MKKIILIIIVVFIVVMSFFVYNFIVNDDDFAPYINREYDETYDIVSNIYDLAVIKKELTSIAEKYEKEVKLTYAQYNIKENNKMAEFQFYKDNYNEKNKACLVTVIVDIEGKKVTKIKYEKGHGKRVRGYSSEINVSEDVSYYINPNENIKIIIANNEIKLFRDNQKIEKTDFIKNITNDIRDGGSYQGVITEINSDNIIFENQSKNEKYLIDINSNFQYVNGRTNEKLNINDIKVGYYIDTFPYDLSNVIAILSNIKGENLKIELIKNLSLKEAPLLKPIAKVKELNIINENKAILTINIGDLVENYNVDSEFDMQIELNSNTITEWNGRGEELLGDVTKLKDVALDFISVRLDDKTINNEIPIATWFIPTLVN